MRLKGGKNMANLKVVQFIPHGSACSVQFGANLTSAALGSGAERDYRIVEWM